MTNQQNYGLRPFQNMEVDANIPSGIEKQIDLNFAMTLEYFDEENITRYLRKNQTLFFKKQKDIEDDLMMTINLKLFDPILSTLEATKEVQLLEKYYKTVIKIWREWMEEALSIITELLIKVQTLGKVASRIKLSMENMKNQFTSVKISGINVIKKLRKEQAQKKTVLQFENNLKRFYKTLDDFIYKVNNSAHGLIILRNGDHFDLSVLIQKIENLGISNTDPFAKYYERVASIVNKTIEEKRQNDEPPNGPGSGGFNGGGPPNDGDGDGPSNGPPGNGPGNKSVYDPRKKFEYPSRIFTEISDKMLALRDRTVNSVNLGIIQKFYDIYTSSKSIIRLILTKCKKSFDDAEINKLYNELQQCEKMFHQLTTNIDTNKPLDPQYIVLKDIYLNFKNNIILFLNNNCKDFSVNIINEHPFFNNLTNIDELIKKIQKEEHINKVRSLKRQIDDTSMNADKNGTKILHTYFNENNTLSSNIIDIAPIENMSIEDILSLERLLQNIFETRLKSFESGFEKELENRMNMQNVNRTNKELNVATMEQQLELQKIEAQRQLEIMELQRKETEAAAQQQFDILQSELNLKQREIEELKKNIPQAL